MDNSGMGSVIRRLRTERGWTQEALAEKLRLTPQAVSRWETGQSLPDVSQVPQLARIFGVTTDTLYGMDEAEEDPFGPTLALSVCDGADPAAAFADWERLAAEQRGGEPWGRSSLHRWALLSLALQLADPGSPVHLPEKASEVRDATLELGTGFPEAEPEEAWEIKAEYRRTLAQLYALAGKQKEAFETLGAQRPYDPKQLRYAEDGEIWRLLGERKTERQNLAVLLKQASDYLLDALYAAGDNALARGDGATAREAAEAALGIIPLLCGREKALPPLHIRERGDLWGLKARAHAALGQQAEALAALEELRTRREALLAGEEEPVDHALFWQPPNPFHRQPEARAWHRVRVLRELRQPELASLRQSPQWEALEKWTDALGKAP